MSHGTSGHIPVVLNKAEILNHLTELAGALAGRGLSCRLVVVGPPRCSPPAGLDLDNCEVVYEHSNLTVLCPPAQQIFLMKLLASRAPDHDDMIVLWPRCGFENAQAAVDAYHLAYPFEEHDPYLVDYVQQIADLADG
ncbi:hypothetical protein GCM10009804_42800 [Kribbella hippodromi]|uniref:Uncharacterized protein n=1 Tax=Kribbella hippodromi TaxID=434347 RepID=A0ABN2DNV1_9ACTN